MVSKKSVKKNVKEKSKNNKADSNKSKKNEIKEKLKVEIKKQSKIKYKAKSKKVTNQNISDTAENTSINNENKISNYNKSYDNHSNLQNSDFIPQKDVIERISMVQDAVKPSEVDSTTDETKIIIINESNNLIINESKDLIINKSKNLVIDNETKTIITADSPNICKIENKIHSFKEKSELLKEIQSDFNDEKIEYYLDFVKYKSMAKAVLDRILKRMIEIDVELTVAYDNMSEEEWDSVNTGSYLENIDTVENIDHQNTVDSQNNVDSMNNINKLLKIFSKNFLFLANSFQELDFSIALEFLSKIFLNKTRNIQFILFLMADNYKRELLSYFLNAPVYNNTAVFCGLVSRHICDDSEKYIKAFAKKYFSGENIFLYQNVKIIEKAQGLLYMLCFINCEDQFVISIVNKIFENSLCSSINRNVVSAFLEKNQNFNCEMNFIKPNDSFNYFPFDYPIIEDIQKLVDSRFRHFSDSK